MACSYLSDLCRVGSFTHSLWLSPFPIEAEYSLRSLLPYFIEIPAFNANNVDPKQTSQTDSTLSVNIPS